MLFKVAFPLEKVTVSFLHPSLPLDVIFYYTRKIRKVTQGEKILGKFPVVGH